MRARVRIRCLSGGRTGRATCRTAAAQFLAVLSCLAAASCAVIGPTIPMEPGAGKTGAAFDGDRRACMAETDRRLQPIADRLNGEAANSRQIQDNNRYIQIAYDDAWGRCMSDRGNTFAPSAVPALGVPAPPTLELALAGDKPVSDASETPALSDADSEAAKRFVAPRVRALLAACPGERIAVAAHDAQIVPGAVARLIVLTQPGGGDCLGHIGESDVLVQRIAGGPWATLLAAEPGSIGVRLDRHAGRRDVEIRSFGECVYGYRWDGEKYAPFDARDCTLPAPAGVGDYAGRIREP
jgi:hypothetical protein